MTFANVIARREISEILHFTTNSGITGITATGYVKSRKRLTRDDYLEHIYMYNCEDRSRDIAWHDYVNLSITTVNRRLFGISAGRWHYAMDGWWCILSFSPEILSHSGVIFTSTNNAYPSVMRYEGPCGLEELFAARVEGRYQQPVLRTPATAKNQPTCQQAEVLYPFELSLDYLQQVYVKCGDEASVIESQLSLFGRQLCECKVQPHLF